MSAPEARSKRETKKVESFTIEVKEKDNELKIEKGAGEKLGELENVVFKMNKLNSASEELKKLHSLCFGKAGVKTVLKRNLREFSGLVSDNMDAEKEKKKASLGKSDAKLIKALLDVCDLSPTGTKAQLVDRLVDFLEKPEASGKKSLVEKAGEKRKAAEKKKEKAEKKTTKVAKGKGKGGKAKKEKQERAPSAYILYCNSRRDKVKAENPDKGMTDITKILAEKWKGISDERKAKYEAQSKELKAELEAKKAKAAAKAGGEPKAKKQKTGKQ